jgi:hypothetical protein
MPANKVTYKSGGTH